MSPNTEPLKAVTYRRVSTSEQAVSGLGLSAQQVTIDRALEARGWVAVAAHARRRHR